MIKQEERCDNCDAVLSDPSPFPSHFLRLTCIKSTRAEIVYDVYLHPPIDATKSFCCLECLRKWSDKNTAGNQNAGG